MKAKVYSSHVIEEGYEYYQLYFAVPELVFWYDGDTVKTDEGEGISHEFMEATPERRPYHMQSLEDMEVPDELIAKLREYHIMQKALEESMQSLNEQREGGEQK